MTDASAGNFGSLDGVAMLEVGKMAVAVPVAGPAMAASTAEWRYATRVIHGVYGELPLAAR